MIITYVLSIILCDIMIIREISLMMLWNYYHKLFLTIVYKNLDKVGLSNFFKRNMNYIISALS